MAKEIQPQTEQLTGTEFLNKVYDSILEDLKNKGSEVVRNFDTQEGIPWTEWSSYPPSHGYLHLDLKKAVLLKDNKKIFLLTLGNGKRGRYDFNQNERLQFGFVHRDKYWEEKIESAPIENFRVLVDHPFGYGFGEFYTYSESGKEKLGVDCWVNARMYGGKDLGRPAEANLFNQRSASECRKIVEKTLKRAYYPKDLR